MSSLARRLARPEILDLPSANAIAGTGQDYTPDIVRLHLNESGFRPLSSHETNANRYPEPSAPRLQQAMAALYGVGCENLMVTRGADDAIDALIRCFCRSGIDSIAHPAPTFGAYSLFARIQGAAVVEVPLEPDFSFDPDRFIKAVKADPSIKLIFLCSPNNPTGNFIPPADVLKVADALSSKIVVLDEAYIEFSSAESLSGEAAASDNLVVLRTLSKAYGIAGARIGCAIGNPELIEIVRKVLPPFPLAAPSIRLALDTLCPSRRLLIERRIVEIRAERERTAECLIRSPLVKRIWPSDTNFLLLEVNDLELANAELARRGIKVRYRPDIAPNAIRLTVGSASDNMLALAALGAPSGPTVTRSAEVVRDTMETRVALSLDLDSSGPRRIQSGLPFFDHMLDQVAAHGGFSLLLSCEGDLQIDAHHSLEDIALSFGEALRAALGNFNGIARFGFALPMDEADAQILIDLSGRPYCRFEGKFASTHIGQYPTEMTAHIFRSIAESLGAAIHVRVDGENDHHKVEACFKAFGRALRQAIQLSGTDIPSTKGLLA
jgi:histidinol-phosphate aminotransferase/imidazoleglycerol-phosphate dehydratase/histidinol-phosphatase